MASAKSALILIVDDEPIIRMVAAESLIDAGFTVVEAANAEEALSVLRSRSDVGLLFTDINMPGNLDGIDLAGLVHRLWPSIKLVITSGRTLNKPLPDHGRFLGKPYDLTRLTALICELAQPDS